MNPDQKPYTAEDMRARRYLVKVKIEFAHYHCWIEIESWTQFAANGLFDVVVKAISEGTFKHCETPVGKEDLIQEIK